MIICSTIYSSHLDAVFSADVSKKSHFKIGFIGNNKNGNLIVVSMDSNYCRKNICLGKGFSFGSSWFLWYLYSIFADPSKPTENVIFTKNSGWSRAAEISGHQDFIDSLIEKISRNIHRQIPFKVFLTLCWHQQISRVTDNVKYISRFNCRENKIYYGLSRFSWNL